MSVRSGIKVGLPAEADDKVIKAIGHVQAIPLASNATIHIAFPIALALTSQLEYRDLVQESPASVILTMRLH